MIQAHNYQHTKIFANRFWGDCGFIYVCFDFINMQGLLKHINKNGYACTEDSQNCFAMEDAALLELVETHKVPIEKNYIGICI